MWLGTRALAPCAILLSVAFVSRAQLLGDDYLSHNNETLFSSELYQLSSSTTDSSDSNPVTRMISSTWSNPCLTFDFPPRETDLTIEFGDFPPEHKMVGKVKYHYLSGYMGTEQTKDLRDSPEPSYGFSKWELDILEILYEGGKNKKAVPRVKEKRNFTAEIDPKGAVVSLPTKVFDQIVKDTDAEVFDEDSDVHYAECKKVWDLNSLLLFNIKDVITSAVHTYSLDAVDLAIEEDPPGEGMESEGVVTKMCRLHIEDSGKAGSLVLGHPFLQKYLTTFILLIPEEEYSHGTEKIPLIALGESKAYLHWKKEMRTHSMEQDWTDKMDKDWKREHKKNWGRTVEKKKKKKKKTKEYPGAEIKKKKIQKQEDGTRGIAFM